MRTSHGSEDLQKFRTWKWGHKAGSLPPLQGKVNWELRLAVRADQNWVQSQRPDRLSPVITQQTQEIWGRPSLPTFFTIALLSDGAELGLSQLNSIIQVSKLPHTSGGKCPMPWYFMGIWVLTDNSSVNSYTWSKNLPLWADSILQLHELVTDNTSMKWRRKLPLLHRLCNCLRWEYWGSRASPTWTGSHLHLPDIIFISKLQTGVSFHPSCWNWTWS